VAFAQLLYAVAFKWTSVTGGSDGLAGIPRRSGPFGLAVFFKWIKQHLRIKQFFGTSENAVKTQIWIAVSVYVLVAIVKKRLKLEASLYTLLQVLSVTLFEKLPLDQALTHDAAKGVTSQITNQLDLFTY
jgi:hypothetical protein